VGAARGATWRRRSTADCDKLTAGAEHDRAWEGLPRGVRLTSSRGSVKRTATLMTSSSDDDDDAL